MTVFEWPSEIKVKDQSWVQKNNSLILTNPLSGSIQIINRPGSFWQVDISTPVLDKEEAGILSALLAKLRGHTHRVRLRNFGLPTPIGNPGGSPSISGSGQTGTSVTTSGWSSSSTVLKRGDMVTVGGELKIITSDIVSDGAGAAVLEFEPMLRASPANGSAIDYTSPGGEFILLEPEWGISTNVNVHSLASLSFREVF